MRKRPSTEEGGRQSQASCFPIKLMFNDSHSPHLGMLVYAQQKENA